jgi:hypothetical protein
VNATVETTALRGGSSMRRSARFNSTQAEGETIMLTSRSASLRLGALVLTALVSATHAPAGIITAYTDRNAWQTAAQAGGLDVSVDNFNIYNAQLPLGVGPATFFVGSGARWGSYNGSPCLRGQDIPLDFYDASDAALFGLGFTFTSLLQSGARIEVADVDNVWQLASGSTGSPDGFGFLGIIGTSAFDPDGIKPDVEIHVYGLPGYDATLDNLSVAYAVPEPASPLLLAVAGLALLRRRCRGHQR